MHPWHVPTCSNIVFGELLYIVSFDLKNKPLSLSDDVIALPKKGQILWQACWLTKEKASIERTRLGPELQLLTSHLVTRCLTLRTDHVQWRIRTSQYPTNERHTRRGYGHIKSIDVGGKKKELKLNTILDMITDISIATESRTDTQKIDNLRHKYKTAGITSLHIVASHSLSNAQVAVSY